MTVSVVIPTYQRCDSLKRTIAALRNQTLPVGKYELIASVDGSSDGTREMLAAQSTPFPLRVVCSGENRGRASACNRGLRESRGELVVVLDDDMEPVSGFLDAHVQCHAEHERRGVLGAVPITCDESSTPVTRYVARKFNAHLQKLAEGMAIDGRAFYTGNFSIRRSVLVEAGAFDESFTRYGNEDVDLAFRLRSRGVDLVYSADALAHQHYEKTMTALARDQMAKGQTAVLLAAKHPESVPKTKLASYGRGSRRWRLARATLIAFARRCPRSIAVEMRLFELLNRRRARVLERVLPHLADYFFWLGVSSALPPRRPLRQAAQVAAETLTSRS